MVSHFGRPSGLAAVQLNIRRSKGLRIERSAEAQPLRFADIGERLAPKGYISWLDKLLARAGRPVGLPLARLLVIKPALALVAALFGLMFFLGSPSLGNFLLPLAVTALVYLIPDVLLHGRGAKRQTLIALELPNMLDQCLISVEAGLGFETAMARIGKNGKGPLAEEIIRTLQDMQAGRIRKDSYLAMSQRWTFPTCAASFGPWSRPTRTALRSRGASRPGQGDAGQAAAAGRGKSHEDFRSRCSFPLIFFILPALFIVILGPAVINIMAVFSLGWTAIP